MWASYRRAASEYRQKRQAENGGKTHVKEEKDRSWKTGKGELKNNNPDDLRL